MCHLPYTYFTNRPESQYVKISVYELYFLIFKTKAYKEGTRNIQFNKPNILGTQNTW